MVSFKAIAVGNRWSSSAHTPPDDLWIWAHTRGPGQRELGR